MKESVFEAYLEDGEELLWEGFCFPYYALPFDFEGPARWRRVSYLAFTLAALFLTMYFFVNSDIKYLKSSSYFLGSSFFVFFHWFRLEKHAQEVERYLSGTPKSGLTFTITNKRLLAYDYESKQLSREQAITPKLSVFESRRGLTIDSPGAKKWVWPLGDGSARTALRIIREARDRLKEEAT